MSESPEVTDPLAQVVELLQPAAAFSKLVSARGPWRVRRAEAGRPFYCAVLEGACRLAADGHPPVVLEAGDFVLIPAAQDFTTSSLAPPPEPLVSVPVEVAPGVFHLGAADGDGADGGGEPAGVRMQVGYCAFGAPDAALLVSLLPRLVHVRGDRRLTTLVQLVDEEARQRRPGRDVILARLLEVLLIEALRSGALRSGAQRSGAGDAGPPGLLRGLADARLAVALRRLHERPTAPWTVPQLAREAGLSRSVFFDRFRRAVGLAPMAYLLHWRMALAKDLLRRHGAGVAEVAERVGYGSASAFSIAFSRHVGVPPTVFARAGGTG